MRELIEQLRRSLDHPDLFFLSLSTALCIPDIAGAIDSENGWSTAAKYKAWYEKYVRPLSRETYRQQLLKVAAAEVVEQFSEHLPDDPLTGEDCYAFRCSLLHQGSQNLKNGTFSRIAFLEPGRAKGRMTGVLSGTLLIDVDTFCRRVIAGAEQWLSEVESSERYRVNSERCARIRPGGLPGAIRGMSVVA